MNLNKIRKSHIFQARKSLFNKIFIISFLTLSIFIYPLTTLNSDTNLNQKTPNTPKMSHGEDFFFSQRDPAWRYDPIIDENGVNQGNIETIGAAMTSCAMVLKYYMVDTDPKQLNTWLSSNNGYASGGLIYWAKPAEFSSGKVSWIDNYGSDTWFFWDDQYTHWNTLKNEVEMGYPVIVEVDADISTANLEPHWVLVTKFNGGAITNPANYYINDPWDNPQDPNKLLSNYYDSTYDNTFFAMRFYRGTLEAEPVITSDLTLYEIEPYKVGDMITGTFTIRNDGNIQITFEVLTIGGRDPYNQVADFTFDNWVTLNPGQSYIYQGSLNLEMEGVYHFFCAYKTPDGNWNTAIPALPGTANTLDIYVISENIPPNVLFIYQYESNGITEIYEGGYTQDNTVVFRGWLEDMDNDQVQLEIELRQYNEPFIGVPTPETISPFVPSYTEAVITRYGLVPGNYHWQYRLRDSRGAVTSWIEYGSPGNIDFTITIIQLSNGYIDPVSGDKNTIFNYYVTYKDQSGLYPNEVNVIINRVPFKMSKESGDITTGAVYKYSRTLSPGIHNFYFEAWGANQFITYPEEGTFSGPEVIAEDPINLQWKDIWGFDEWTMITDIALDDQDNIYYIGSVLSSLYQIPGVVDNLDVYIGKFDNNGIELWNVTWGGDLNDYGAAIAVDNGGNVYATGYTSNIDADAFLLKLDSSGNVLWHRTLGEHGVYDAAYTLSTDISGNIFIAGTTTYGYDYQNVFLAKYDNLGNFLWRQIWENPDHQNGRKITIDSLGNVYLVGFTLSGDYWDGLLLKYSNSGDLLWSRTWDYGFEDIGISVAVDQFNNVYIAGARQVSMQIIYDISLLKFDSSGSILWEKSWGTPEKNDYATDLVLDSGGNIYLSGITRDDPSTFDDIVLIKFDNIGNEVWFETWGLYNHDEYASSIELGSGNNIYVSGASNSYTNAPLINAFSSDMSLLKYDQTGNLLWEKIWGGTSSDFAFETALNSVGDIYLAGSTQSIGSGCLDIVLIKYNDYGKELWSTTWGDLGNEMCYGMGIDSSDNIYLVGTKEVEGIDLNYDMCLLKYNINGELLWDITWGMGDIELGFSLTFDSLENVYVAGWRSMHGLNRPFIVKYDRDGNELWGKILNRDNYISLDIKLDANDNIFLVGHTQYLINEGEAYLTKFDSEGTELWLKLLSSYGIDVSYSLCLDSDGNVYVGGLSYGTDYYSSDMCALKFDNQGSFINKVTWDNLIYDICFTMTTDQFNNLYLAGTSLNIGSIDVCIVKYDSAGNEMWYHLVDLGSDETCTSIVVDEVGNIYIAGFMGGNFYPPDTNMFIAKFSQGTYEPRSSSLFDGMFLDFTASGSFIDFDTARVSYSQLSENIFQATITSADYYAWYDVNKQTRIISNSGGNLYFMEGTHSIYWIFTDSQLGDYVPILVDGEGDHIFRIHGDRNYYLPGFGTVEVWELEDLSAPGAHAWYEKSTGVLIKGFFYYNDGNDYYEVELVDSNADFEIYDINPPIVVINSPIGGEIHGEFSPSYNLVVTDESGIDLMWYTLDGGVTNQTFTELTGTINQELWDACAEGIVNIEFYAKDLAGNIGYAEVIVVKEINQAPDDPIDLYQLESDGITTIPEGGETFETTIIFKGLIGDPDADDVRLEIELREFGQSFTGEPLLFSDYVPSGSVAIIIRQGLIDGRYHWQYRARDSNGHTSDWIEFHQSGNIDLNIKKSYVRFELSDGWQYKQLFTPTIHRSSEDPKKLEVGIYNKRDMWYILRFYKRFEGGPWIEIDPVEGRTWYFLHPYGEYSFDYTPEAGEELKIEVINDLNDEKLTWLWRFDFLMRAAFGFSVSPEISSPVEAFTRIIGFFNEFVKLGSYIGSKQYKSAVMLFIKMLLTNEKLRTAFSSLIYLFTGRVITAPEILAKVSSYALVFTVLMHSGLWSSLIVNTVLMPFIEDVVLKTKLIGEYDLPNIIVTENLEIFEEPYYVNKIINGKFTIKNIGSNTIILKSLTIGGRGPDDSIRDFSFKTDITINPGESYTYEGEFIPLESGFYHFFIAYETYDHEWVTSLPTEDGISNTLDIFIDPIPGEWKGAIVECPVELRVINSLGRRVGSFDGEILNEIPNSYYYEDLLIIFFPDEEYTLYYELEGLSIGTYNLTIFNSTKIDILNFTATNIPTIFESIHQYEIDWDLLSQGEVSVNVDIDSDGDGTIDHSFTSDDELNTAEYAIETLTWIYEGDALQDGVVFDLETFDNTFINWITVSIREPGGEDGIIISDEIENIPLIYNVDHDIWESINFDTTQLPDGYYVLFVQVCDASEFTSTITFDFSIRNWALLELLPSTERNRAGRTMPVKFSLSVVETVDPEMPFVCNEELEIIIYDENNPDIILQHSILGDTSVDYRISSEDELYITNFKTSKTEATYVVEIWRKGMRIGLFEFETYKSKIKIGASVSSTFEKFQILLQLNSIFLLLGMTYLLTISRKKLIHL